MLSKKTKYALQALLCLARNRSGKPVLIADIAQNENIPRKFLESILLQLREKGYTGSKKGKGGGYFLIRQPETIFVTELIRELNGPIALLPCASLNFYQKCGECPDEELCGIRDMFRELRDRTLKLMADKTLADLLNREQKLKKILNSIDV